MQSVTLSSEGKITIPPEIRKRLGLHEGDQVEFIARGEDIVVRAARRNDNPFARFRGALANTLPHGIEAILTEEREMRGREE